MQKNQQLVRMKSKAIASKNHDSLVAFVVAVYYSVAGPIQAHFVVVVDVWAAQTPHTGTLRRNQR